MIKYILLLLFFAASLIFNDLYAQELEFIRKQYPKAITDRESCREMIALLDNEKQINVVALAYLGAFETIWANHVFNPISKLNTFNKGKNKIEKAVKKEPDNFEIRFIRLSIQQNAPSFLGYGSNIIEDKAFIKTNIHLIDAADLKKNVQALLKE